MKKVLYFFPDDITRQTAGNITRALYLLKYFNQKGFAVDFVSVIDEKIKNTQQGTQAFFKEQGLNANVYLIPRKVGKQNPVYYFFRYKLWNLIYYLFAYPLKSNIPTYLTLKIKKEFNKIQAANTYDDIIISYVYCAGLIANKNLLKGAKTIIDTHDFITAQFKGKKNFNMGITFEDEIERLNTFDEIWAISNEEQYIFNQFCKSPVNLIPFMMDEPLQSKKPASEREFDLIYIASDNVHNIKSAKWFFNEVYPLLPKELKIAVIGKINNYIADGYVITRIPFAEKLEGYYNNSKIALCPMLQGTGVKIKVVEALAYGLPVVCTSRGTDGLPNKQDNGCMVSDDVSQFAKNIMALLQDESLYEHQSHMAKQLFNNSFSSNVVFKLLDRSFI